MVNRKGKCKKCGYFKKEKGWKEVCTKLWFYPSNRSKNKKSICNFYFKKQKSSDINDLKIRIEFIETKINALLPIYHIHFVNLDKEIIELKKELKWLKERK